jgi:predicted metal-dependent phosphoesterase TrpH
VLSPDGDDFMTPNNILNMAMLKDLDFVAITDHNSAKQLHTVEEIEKAYDFIIIPGIEVTVNEYFDVLCYFKTYEQAYALDAFIEPYLVVDDWDPFTREDQIITDIYDEEKELFPKSLKRTSIPYHMLYEKVHEIGGICVLAHIARASKSALLFYKLDDIPFDGIEIQSYQKEAFLKEHPTYNKYKILTSSDAHSLLTILERIEYLELSEKSIDAFFEYFEGRETDE